MDMRSPMKTRSTQQNSTVRERLIAAVAALLGIILGMVATWLFFVCVAIPQTATAHVETPEAFDKPMPVEEEPAGEEPAFVFSYNEDMQYPELPTGCEATALSTLLRLNGIEASKTEVADAMPKGSDWVNQFCGDPYTQHGMCCMAPCAIETAKRFCPVEKTPVNLTGTQLVYLPTPCVVWVTMELQEPWYSGQEIDGYELLWNTHCVTLLAAGEATVKVIDPLQGMQEYPFSKFNAAYMGNGSQAVYIADRGYEPLN